MAKVGSLLIDLAMNTARLQADAGKAAQSINRMERNFKRSFSRIESNVLRITRSLRGFGATLGIVAGGGGLLFMGKSSLDAADKIQKLSLRLGVSTEALSQLQHAAALSGVSFETFTMGLQRMTRRISEAANGTGEAQAALVELGVSANELGKLLPEQQFEVLAEAMTRVEGQSNRVRLAMKLFDSEGVALLQMMGKGAAGIREYMKEADDLGLTLRSNTANAAATLNDQITKLSNKLKGLFVRALTAATPWINAFVAGLEKIGLTRAVQRLQEVNTEINETRGRILELQSSPGVFDRAREIFGVETLEEAVQRHRLLLGELLLQRDEAQKQLAQMRKDMESGRPKSVHNIEITGGLAPDPFPPSYMTDLREKMAEVQSIIGGGWAGQLESVTTQMDDLRIITADAFQSGLIDFATYQSTMTAIQEEETRRRVAIEKNAMQSVANLRSGALNNLAGFLQAWGQRNKSAAAAAVVLQKAMAIAQIKVETEKAAMAAYAWGMIFGGPGAAKIAAAEARSIGALSMALVAATGLMEISNINSNAGTSTGGVAASSNTVSTVGGATQGTSTSGQQTTIILQGDVYGFDDFREKVTEAVRAATDSDTIIIGRNTRQALEFA